MHGDSTVLIQLLYIFAAAVIFVPLTQKLKLGSIIGYLLAGLLVGPAVLNVVNDLTTITYIAEFGVVFLLFLIGIEMKPRRLWTMRKNVLGLGGLQILITGALFALIAFLFGLPTEVAVIVGAGLALSSTAMGIQLLSDQQELHTASGRTSFSILLMQDLSVPILLSLVTVMAGSGQTSSKELALGIAEGVGLLILTFILSRTLLKPILSVIAGAKVTEVFTAFALLLVLGMAYLMEHIGMSLAMGAFLAGMFLADSEYRHQIEADIQPFRGLLLGLFFMGIGMGINLGLLQQQWLLVIGLVVLLMISKAAIILVLTRMFGSSLKDSYKSGVYLCQAGEFGFVLFAFAASQGVLQQETLGILMLTTALSMALTPILLPLLLPLSTYFKDTSAEEKEACSAAEGCESSEGSDSEHKAFIIAGFGRVGRTVAVQLQEAGYGYIAFDTSLEKVKSARASGYNVFYGNASQLDVLKAAHADQIAGLILTMDDRKAQLRTAEQIRKHYPDIPLHARAHDLSEASELKRRGVKASVPETIEASLQLGFCAMANHPDQTEDSLQSVKQKTDDLRAHDYAKLADLLDNPAEQV